MSQTKKFAQMSTKKLTALLETASQEDAVAINAILAARNAQSEVGAEQQLSEEEQAAIKAAENAQQESEAAGEPKEKKVGGRKASPKMSEEELDAIHEEAKKNVGHRCSAVLPGSAVRVDGTILTTLKDKRAMQVYYQIETDATDDIESRKIYKKFGAEGLEISDEVVELKKKTSSKVRVAKEKLADGEWENEVKAVRAAITPNIGKSVRIDGLEGRITNLMADKRSCGFYYRIELFDELAGQKKVSHKVINYSKDEAGNIVLAPFAGMDEELDEAGKKINQAFTEREARAPRKVLTPEEKVVACEEAVKKAEAALLKAQESLAAKKLELANAKEWLESCLANKAEAALEGDELA